MNILAKNIEKKELVDEMNESIAYANLILSMKQQLLAENVKAILPFAKTINEINSISIVEDRVIAILKHYDSLSFCNEATILAFFKKLECDKKCLRWFVDTKVLFDYIKQFTTRNDVWLLDPGYLMALIDSYYQLMFMHDLQYCFQLVQLKKDKNKVFNVTAFQKFIEKYEDKEKYDKQNPNKKHLNDIDRIIMNNLKEQISKYIDENGVEENFKFFKQNLKGNILNIQQNISSCFRYNDKLISNRKAHIALFDFFQFIFKEDDFLTEKQWHKKHAVLSNSTMKTEREYYSDYKTYQYHTIKNYFRFEEN
jgi:hypothetical protein